MTFSFFVLTPWIIEDPLFWNLPRYLSIRGGAVSQDCTAVTAHKETRLPTTLKQPDEPSPLTSRAKVLPRERGFCMLSEHFAGGIFGSRRHRELEGAGNGRRGKASRGEDQRTAEHIGDEPRDAGAGVRHFEGDVRAVREREDGYSGRVPL